MNLKNSTTLEVLRELSEKNVTGSEHMFASWLVWLEINYENELGIFILAIYGE